MTETTSADPTAAAPQSLALDARAVAMLKAMGVSWRWPAPPVAAPTAQAAPSAQAAETAPAPLTTTPTPPAAPVAAVSPKSSATPPAPIRATVSASSEPAPQALRPMALGGLDWQGLQAQVEQCQACGLHRGRSHTSWGQGEPHARWLFVTPGLHPTDLGTETVQGGEWRLLQSMWRAMGLKSDEVFVTSLTKCRPAMGLSPSPQDTAQCLQYLEHQHQRLQPEMIVALGLPVAHALLGASTAPLSQWRGQVHHWRQTPLIVTYPLDSLLRRPIDQGKAWADLCLGLDHVSQTARTPTETAQP
jgi:uracil-DNA glycosylase